MRIPAIKGQAKSYITDKNKRFFSLNLFITFLKIMIKLVSRNKIRKVMYTGIFQKASRKAPEMNKVHLDNASSIIYLLGFLLYIFLFKK